MFMHKNKKGFTIVELVIVIAVIAILAAVLIPTFSNLVKKANQSADIQATRQMNTVLTGEKLDDIDAVIDVLAKNGYNSKKALVPVSTDHGFFWYPNAKKIVLVKGTEVIFPADVAYEADGISLGESVKFIDVNATTADALDAAFAAGTENIKLEADLTLTSTSEVSAGATVTVDLNGKTLSTAVRDSNGSHHYALDVKGTVIFENGTVDARGVQLYEGGKLVVGEGATINALDDNGGACMWISGGELVIDGGTFNATNGDMGTDIIYEPAIINNTNGKITINDGTFNAASSCYAIVNNSGEIVINGGTFVASRGVISAGGGKVTINGGTFTVTGQDVYTAHVVYACDGEIVINGGTFTNNGGAGCFKFCVDIEGSGSITVDGKKLTAGMSK